MPKSNSSCSSREGYTAHEKNFMLADADNEDRLGYVRKVYGILAAQLTVTFGFTACVQTIDSLRANILFNSTWAAIFMLSWITALIVQIGLLCCIKNARRTPTNYILLSIFTICWTIMIGCITADVDQATVLTATLMTAVITITLSTYAMFTKSDFTTMCGPFVCFGLLIILLVSIAMSLLSMLVFTFADVWIPFAAGFGVLVYGLFLLIDTQLVVGGGRYELSIDDYVVGALILYIDIIMIFLYLLRMFGGK